MIFLKPLIGVAKLPTENDKSASVKLGFSVKNIAEFPISFEVKKIESSIGTSFNPNPVYSSRKIDVDPAVMSHGKYLSLEEACKYDQLDPFTKEHSSAGDENAFDEMLNHMAGVSGSSASRTESEKPSTGAQISSREACED